MSYNKVDNFESLLGDDIIQPDDDLQVPQNDSPQPLQSHAPAQPKSSTQSSHMFHINFYRSFFDLDTETFFQKIQRSINPFTHWFSDEEEVDNSATELYGFIWITGTLIFLMFVSSTGSNILSQWIHHSEDDDSPYEYSFTLLTLSISLFYGYNFIVPTLLFLFTSYFLKFPQRLTLTKVISIYGYTNILWFPITLVNFLIVVFISNKKHHFLLNILEWAIVLISGGITGLSNVAKLFPQIKQNSLLLSNGELAKTNALLYTIIGILAFLHLIFTVLVKVSFFGIN